MVRGSARSARVAVVVIMAVLTSGCLSDAWDSITGNVDRESRTLYNHAEPFSVAGIFDPTNPPGSADDAWDRFSGSFNVPEDARNLVVTYVIDFRGLGDQEPPDGTVELRLMLSGPGQVGNQSVSFTEDGSGQWVFDEPEAGTYGISMLARGEGTAAFSAIALVPVDD